MAQTPFLQVERLTKIFGGIVALNDVSFDVRAGEILGIIGPNGAGKTTLFNLISGVHAPTSGTVRMDGQPLAGLKPHQRARLGLGRTFQTLHLFENMTVAENVMVGGAQAARYGLFAAAARWPQATRAEAQMRADALQKLELIGLAERADAPIAALPFGQQRLVQIARALAAGPRLLLLDEPAAGLTRGEINVLDDIIRRLAAQALTILLVEHDMQLVMNLVDRALVLNFGEKIAEGAPNAIQQNPAVIAAYLGEEQGAPSLPTPEAPATGRMGEAPLLRIQDLSTYYGPLRALDGASLYVDANEIVAIIGANGAGKTTLLNTIAGLLTPRAGAIFLNGRNIAGAPTEAIVRAGVSLVPERRQIFGTLSVRDNLLLGAYSHEPRGAEFEADLSYVFDLFPILKTRERQLGGTLSGGEQQMLAVARGLMSRPKLLLLDEPSVGLAPLLVREILDIVVNLRARGTTILLVEQNAQAALQVADRAYVFETGRIALAGSAADLSENAQVQRAYLGAVRV